MFVPGHKQEMIDKAVGLKADVLIFDLEDGVPPTEVDRARRAVGTALGRSPAGPTRFVRTHGPRHAGMDADLQAVDKVYPDIRDRAGLARETRKARQLGFTGKALIHPAQIGTVHRVFSPTQEEVEYARRVVAAFEAAPDEGAIAVDGRLVDLPVVERARRILQWREEES